MKHPLISLCNPLMQLGLIAIKYADHFPDYRFWIDRNFHRWHSLNYAHSGEIWWAPGTTVEPIRLEAPVAWWTRPGGHYRYGRRDGLG